MLFRPNPSLGVPIYLQLMEQVKHAVETGALRPGDQLPGIRPLAEELVINPNTVAKAYRELEHEGVIELRHGAGAFVTAHGGGRKAADKVGAARVFGLAADAPDASVEIRRRTGFVSEDKELFDFMTVEEIVRFTAPFFPRWRRDLEERYRRTFELRGAIRVKALSRGMRTKLALLLALCRGAELLVLDEPTAGLDPAATEELLQALVKHVAAQETSVFFSSHQIAEVDQIADHLAIIDAGRSVLTGALDDI